MNTERENRSLSLMNINELCEAAGVSRSTVYHYLRSGLLQSPIKEGPTKLRYDQTHRDRLLEIRHFREKKKLSLTEIQKMFQVSASPENILEKDADEVKNLIVDKAIELISKKGFSKTKISDIAEELNMGKGTFYLYFKNKEELFLKCIERFSDIFLPKELWEDIKKERHYFKRTSKRMLYMLQSFQTFMGIVSIVKLAIRGTDPELSKIAMDCFQVIISPVAKELRRNIELGLVREVDAEFVSFLLLGVGEAAGYWRMMHPEYTAEEATEKIIDFMELGLGLGHDQGPYDQKKKPAIATIVDKNGNTIQLAELRANDQEQLSGKMGNGTLEVPFKQIASIEMIKADADHFALVMMASNEKIKIKVDGNAILSGNSSFGKYAILLSDLATVVRFRGIHDEIGILSDFS